jgi:hypothetical protein
LKYRAFSGRDFDKGAAASAGANYAKIRQSLDNLRRTVSPPWRMDEKQAAMAAWIVLHK